MGFKRKKFFAYALAGILALGIPLITVCLSLCPTVDAGSDFSRMTKCTFSSHSYVQIGIGHSTLFIISLMGLLLIMGTHILPEGFFLSPYRPPRLHA
jgi:hypothetical protein